MRRFRYILGVFLLVLVACGDNPMEPEKKVEENPLLDIGCMFYIETLPVNIIGEDGEAWGGIVDLRVSWEFHEDGTWNFKRVALNSVYNLPEGHIAIETNGFYYPDHLSSNVWTYMLHRQGGRSLDPQTGVYTSIGAGSSPTVITLFLSGDGKVYMDNHAYSPCN